MEAASRDSRELLRVQGQKAAGSKGGRGVWVSAGATEGLLWEAGVPLRLTQQNSCCVLVTSGIRQPCVCAGARAKREGEAIWRPAGIGKQAWRT